MFESCQCVGVFLYLFRINNGVFRSTSNRYSCTSDLLHDNVWVCNGTSSASILHNEPVTNLKMPVGYFTEEGKSNLAKPSLKFNGGLAKRAFTSIVK